MYRTITLGSFISVQGRVVKTLDDGRVQIRIGERVFEGYPVDEEPAPKGPKLATEYLEA